MNTAQLSERLKYYRKIKGLSQEELSLRTNVTVRTIQRIEKSEVNPHLKTVKLLAAALDVEVTELLLLDHPKEETIKIQWLLLLHATPLLGLVIPLSNVLIPLFLWIHKRDDNPVYNTHGIKIINFHISILIYGLLVFVSLLSIETWGFILFIAYLPTVIVIVIMNIISAVKRQTCYYPLSVPFLKLNPSHLTLGALTGLVFSFMSCDLYSSQTIERLDGSLISQDSLTHNIEHLADAANISGMAIAVFNDYKPVYQKVYGYKNTVLKTPLSDTTNLYGASLSKAVFSVLVMRLVEDSIIDLDTPLESYLPKKIHEYTPQTRWHDDYSDLKQDSLYAKITARMCLNHSTGFANWRFLEPDKKLRVHTFPGTQYSYSGEGFVYLQVVLERLTGKSLEALAQEYVFQPLNMQHSSYQWQEDFEKDFAFGHDTQGALYKKDKDNEPRAGSTLETSFKDYTQFLTAVLQKQLLSDASYEELFSPQIRIHSEQQFGPGAFKTTHKYDGINLSCALGWLYMKTPHGIAVAKGGHGDGFQHYGILFPETGKGLLIMTNSDNGESIYKSLLELGIGDSYTPWEWANYIPFDQE